MSELISGKEAKLAWANGEELQLQWCDSVIDEWCSLTNGMSLNIFEQSDIQFRLKPRTIILNGVEVPAPFEPKIGEIYYYLNTLSNQGYSKGKNGKSARDAMAMKYGAWRTEDEIKQVVALLNTVFKSQPH